jgi:quercetin dioxygenase-like cupin family protein
MRLVLIPLIAFVMATPAMAADAPPAAGAPVPTLYSTALPDVPGKQLIVVRLKLAPTGSAKPRPHRHPGSVYVYVTQGTARLGVEGQPVQVVPAGGSFFEPKGALHVVAESASPTEPAYAIAVMIVPDGAPLVLPPDDHGGH